MSAPTTFGYESYDDIPDVLKDSAKPAVIRVGNVDTPVTKWGDALAVTCRAVLAAGKPLPFGDTLTAGSRGAVLLANDLYISTNMANALLVSRVQRAVNALGLVVTVLCVVKGSGRPGFVVRFAPESVVEANPTGPDAAAESGAGPGNPTDNEPVETAGQDGVVAGDQGPPHGTGQAHGGPAVDAAAPTTDSKEAEPSRSSKEPPPAESAGLTWKDVQADHPTFAKDIGMITLNDLRALGQRRRRKGAELIVDVSEVGRVREHGKITKEKIEELTGYGDTRQKQGRRIYEYVKQHDWPDAWLNLPKGDSGTDGVIRWLSKQESEKARRKAEEENDKPDAEHPLPEPAAAEAEAERRAVVTTWIGSDDTTGLLDAEAWRNAVRTYPKDLAGFGAVRLGEMWDHAMNLLVGDALDAAEGEIQKIRERADAIEVLILKRRKAAKEAQDSINSALGGTP